MRKIPVRNSLLVLLLLLSLPFTGCRSPFVAVTITNQSDGPISLIEVDYPSASFGVGSLALGNEFHYRFKIQGSGPVKIQFTDAAGKAHSATGPELKEKQEGSMTITIGSNAQILWDLHLSGTK
ncbi:MAG TPA: hypothetical protein VHT24_06695 [Pseudacidobacterium sp.]|jgi:hypothetical protein|nr:hypothetical protein [Pseudacidobacterium sp.]